MGINKIGSKSIKQVDIVKKHDSILEKNISLSGRSECVSNRPLAKVVVRHNVYY